MPKSDPLDEEATTIEDPFYIDSNETDSLTSDPQSPQNPEKDNTENGTGET